MNVSFVALNMRNTNIANTAVAIHNALLQTKNKQQPAVQLTGTFVSASSLCEKFSEAFLPLTTFLKELTVCILGDNIDALCFSWADYLKQNNLTNNSNHHDGDDDEGNVRLNKLSLSCVVGDAGMQWLCDAIQCLHGLTHLQLGLCNTNLKDTHCQGLGRCISAHKNRLVSLCLNLSYNAQLTSDGVNILLQSMAHLGVVQHIELDLRFNLGVSSAPSPPSWQLLHCCPSGLLRTIHLKLPTTKDYNTQLPNLKQLLGKRKEYSSAGPPLLLKVDRHEFRF
eukprot:TRINITY_DN66525_c2_g1_i1.p1 TRINITY_DN66525_c2_g1~~TRINITY_DN66525_c2_g1_i1.p1  ORF type:complete len:281 (-),score=9.52 TRINITY_DN66525_c2_g1_i1:90-932(-)